MLTILNNKPVIGTTEEDLRLDLTYPARTSQYGYDPAFVVVVKKHDSMRVDILSSNFFGAPDFWDMILKSNGIANPFSIDENEVFYAPQLDELISNNSPSGRQTQSAVNIRSQYINPAKKSLTDSRLAIVEAQRLEAMKKKSETSPLRGNFLPPNVASEGDREITISGGKIFFGKDVVRGVEACTEPISKSEFLAKLIKNRTK
jgi:hypothetical protein